MGGMACPEVMKASGFGLQQPNPQVQRYFHNAVLQSIVDRPLKHERK
jgi:hypothetical protein